MDKRTSHPARKSAQPSLRAAICAAIIAAWPFAPAGADVRHAGYPAQLQGVWAPSAEECGDGSTSRIVIREKRLVWPKAECEIDYVEERAGTRGPIFSGRGSCISREQPQTQDTKNLIVEPRNDGTTWMGTSFETLVQYHLCGK
jgi:hypothetical protein